MRRTTAPVSQHVSPVYHPALFKTKHLLIFPAPYVVPDFKEELKKGGYKLLKRAKK